MAELNQLQSAIPGEVGEVKRWNFWDRISVAAATPVPSPSVYFQTPMGSGGKTTLDTNFRGNGILPAGQFFEIHAIGVHATLNVAGDDNVFTTSNVQAQFLSDLLERGRFVLQSGGSKTELEVAPLLKLGAGCGFTGFGVGSSQETIAAAAGGWTHKINNGVPADVGMFSLGDQIIVLTPNRNFTPTLDWLVPPTTPAATILDLWMFFDGYLHRPA